MYFQALPYTCILSMLFLIDGILTHPTILENLVRMQAETIIHRINLHNEKLNLSQDLIIGDPELYPEVLADKTIQGLGSIVDTLTNFEESLQNLRNGHVNQLHSDVFDLLGYLNETMTSMHCTPKERGNANEQSLKTFRLFYQITFRHMTLNRLKDFMEKLIVNLDQLKSC